MCVRVIAWFARRHNDHVMMERTRYGVGRAERQCAEPFVWTIGSAPECCAHSFWGGRVVCVVAAHCHHGDREHDQRYVAMPSVNRRPKRALTHI